MNNGTVIRCRLRVAVLGAIMLVAALAFATRAAAHVSGGTCSAVTVRNNTNCTFNFTLDTSPSGAIPTMAMSPGSIHTFPTPSGIIPSGAYTAFGNLYLFVATPSGSPAPRVVKGITQGPPDCCVDVWADPAACTGTILPAGGPGPCND
ncbi:MAG TPA: hypothetical protein VHI13_21520 [Candidatus Kapabacteria bacterium]|nr:hypothetical protein [Candidatus Kapabacteria bacterium]